MDAKSDAIDGVSTKHRSWRMHDRVLLAITAVLLLPAYGLAVFLAVQAITSASPPAGAGASTATGTDQRVLVAIWSLLGVVFTTSVALVTTLLNRSQGLRAHELDIRSHELKVRSQELEERKDENAHRVQLDKLDLEKRIELARDAQDQHQRSIDLASQKRNDIETVSRCLQLLTGAGGATVSEAQAGGAIAALVHLGHAPIAVSALQSAWITGSLGAQAAVQLISAVLDESDSAMPEDSGEAQLTDPAARRAAEANRRAVSQACELLRQHAHRLAGADHGNYAWPAAITRRWPVTVPVEGKHEIVQAARILLLSRGRNWWGRDWVWLAGLFRDMREAEAHNSYLRDFACALLKPMAEAFRSDVGRIQWGDEAIAADDLMLPPTAFQVDKDPDVQAWQREFADWRSGVIPPAGPSPARTPLADDA